MTCIAHASPHAQDADCGDKNGQCVWMGDVWWQADEDFPQDSELGPYQNWTDAQLVEKIKVCVCVCLCQVYAMF